jgi:ribonuclease BN (tRNA processing enzyme)
VLLLDAGTGIRRLLTSPSLMDGVASVDVLLSHFHLDHVVGLSYLPGLPAGVECTVWGPGSALYGTATSELLERLIGPPLFALTLLETVSEIAELPMGELDIGPLRLQLRAQEKHTHPSVAMRVGDELTYCTDTGYDPGNAPFATGSRHLLHEAFWLDDAQDHTHSTAEEAAIVARDAGVDDLTLVHLNPRLGEEAQFCATARRLFARAQVGRDLDAVISTHDI